jgi:hypothetical protein
MSEPFIPHVIALGVPQQVTSVSEKSYSATDVLIAEELPVPEFANSLARTSFATADMPGSVRFPVRHWKLNTECELIVRVQHGVGLLLYLVNGEEGQIELREGLVVRIPTGIPYAYHVSGPQSLGLDLTSAPPWNNAQSKLVDGAGNEIPK